MAKKKRKTRESQKRRKRQFQDAKFELSLDATYDVDQKSLFNFGRSMGLSKRKARSASRKLRPRGKKQRRRVK
tara:strand:- start:334 stop:552 length:219 start_codon:yes stop_codon:yes gene_type:complete